MDRLSKLRTQYQQKVCSEAIFMKQDVIPSIADVGSKLSVQLAQSMLQQMGFAVHWEKVNGQTAGKRFEDVTKEYLEASFELLAHLRPGQWIYSVQGSISDFVQYAHLSTLTELIRSSRELRMMMGNYVVKPDIVIGKMPFSDAEINRNEAVVDTEGLPKLTPARSKNSSHPLPFLHASISCKLTLRSDRSQNARTEGLNLIRNRKGHTPHIVIVTAEPMPTRIASLALGMGDIDCVYHFALHELRAAVYATDNEAVIESLEIMIEGNRLRDIADLSFDLAV